MTIREDVQKLSDDAFQEFKRWVNITETQRRKDDAAKAEFLDEMRADGVVESPAPPVDEADKYNIDAYPAWKNPGTIHALMYTFGNRVRHNGRVWESMTSGLNSWEPGGTGVYDFIWLDITDSLTPPEPEPDEPTEPEAPAEPAVPEWSAGVTYNAGDLVAYNGGTVYLVLQAHTSADHWRPDAVASLYQAQ
ncbi:carbohydrate-binding protein [Corynebacterium sp. H113]|uniref:carbohydrate-binding protein n=1 Tax=Corynebacterium sp. H113 TaxID=3133419 RepID=UPI00309D9676